MKSFTNYPYTTKLVLRANQKNIITGNDKTEQ